SPDTRNTNAKKNSGHELPCGVAAPSESTTGRCQMPQRIPRTIAPTNGPNWRTILGYAYPDQPISSKKPAAIPIANPTGKRLGANAGDTASWRDFRTSRTQAGGISSAAMYQYQLTFQRSIRRKSERSPRRPQKAAVSRTPTAATPTTMAGKIAIALEFA